MIAPVGVQEEKLSTVPSSAPKTVQQSQAAAATFLDQLEELAEAGTASEFFSRLMVGLHESFGVTEATIWSIAQDHILLDAVFEEGSLRIRPETPADHPTIPLVQSVCETGNPTVITPGSHHVQSEFRNETESVLAVQPSAVTDDQKFALIAALPADIDTTGLNWAQRLLGAVAEVCGDFYRRQRLVTQVSEHQTFATFREFAREIHQQLDLQQTSHQIANESQRLLECDRTMLFVIEPWSVRLGAASGVFSPDQRSLSLKLLRNLVKDVAREPQVIEFTAAESSDSIHDTTNPHRRQLFDDYQKESKVHRLILLPLPFEEKKGSDKQNVGILAIEDFEERTVADRPRRMAWIAEQTGPAIHHCQQWQRRGLKGIFSDVRGVLRTFGWLISLAILIIAGIALTTISTDFTIAADGVLQPVNRRYVFAPETGRIAKLAITNEQPVKKDQFIARFENPELIIRRDTLQGDKLTAETELDSVIAQRLQNRFSSNSNGKSNEELAAEEKELKQKIENLKGQIQLLDDRIARMTVNSPIAGRVFKWDLERTLEGRTVQQGDRLILVADTEGDWNIVLDISDRDVNHVTNAQRGSDNPIKVRYVLGTSPDEEYEAELGKIAAATELTSEGKFITRATVPIDNTLAGIRPGSSVHARIYCGRRSVGYVWFREVIEFLQRNFYL